MLTVLPTTSETAKPPRPKLWIPVSLRMIAAIVLLLSVGSALSIGVPAYRQQLAIRYFQGLGIAIRPDTSRLGPNWIRHLVGERQLELLGRVQNLNLSDVDVTDADVACLKDFNGLEWLALNRTPITDDGMRHLGAITTLKALRVEDTRVTDEGLAYLAGLQNLEVLSLKRTRVTGSGLKHLNGLALRFLDLEGNQIAGDALRSLPGIEELRLGGR